MFFLDSDHLFMYHGQYIFTDPFFLSVTADKILEISNQNLLERAPAVVNKKVKTKPQGKNKTINPSTSKPPSTITTTSSTSQKISNFFKTLDLSTHPTSLNSDQNLTQLMVIIFLGGLFVALMLICMILMYRKKEKHKQKQLQKQMPIQPNRATNYTDEDQFLLSLLGTNTHNSIKTASTYLPSSSMITTGTKSSNFRNLTTHRETPTPPISSSSDSGFRNTSNLESNSSNSSLDKEKTSIKASGFVYSSAAPIATPQTAPASAALPSATSATPIQNLLYQIPNPTNFQSMTGGCFKPTAPRMGISASTLNSCRNGSYSSTIINQNFNPNTITEKSCFKPKFISMQDLVILNQIGSGEFGKVEVAQHKLTGQILAVKSLTTVTPSILKDFQAEVEIIMKINSQVDSQHIVKLLGVTEISQPGTGNAQNTLPGMILEYHENGDLHTFLKNRQGLIPVQKLWDIAYQICSGMVELSRHNIVHRDLAARNILIDKNLDISIGDFGMSRDTFSSNYYKLSGRAILPIRWMAWECVLMGTFSSKSDIWSFAVTLWEIFNFCQNKPFENYSDEEIIRNFYKFFHGQHKLEIKPESGQNSTGNSQNLNLSSTCPSPMNLDLPDMLQLEKPKYFQAADESVWFWMNKCWSRNKEDRPEFGHFLNILENKTTQMNVTLNL